MRLLQLALMAAFLFGVTGCVLTKVVTVPMRVTGAVISVIPVAGNAVDKAVDTVADTVDKIPF